MSYAIERLSDEEQVPGAQCHSGNLQRAGESLGRATGKTVAKSRDFAKLVRERAERVKEEKPLQFLAVLTSVAVVAGLAIRLWRASNNE
jgi:hypothetical protein